MGNLNFQDEDSDQEHQTSPSQNRKNEEKVEDIFVDEPTTGTKILWIALAVVVIAALAGIFYMLNSHGYLKFGKKAAVTQTTQSVPSAPATRDTTESSPMVSGSQGAATGGGYSLQVSAFRTRAQADRYVAQLKRQGIDGYIILGEGNEGGRWYRVCVGSYPNRIQAIAAIEGMRKRVRTDVWVVPAQ